MALDPVAGRQVAIKMLLDPHRKPHRLQRFEREARALARLDHAGVVKVHRADLAGGHPCLVMEYVAGRSLDVAMQEAPPLDARLEWLEQIARAVAAAHAAGVIHRDLKPENVLVDTDGQIKVTDFGLARDLDRDTRLTETGTMLGTPSYMAPEQVRGGDVGPPTDVWALGVLTYWALTDERPFAGETVIELCHQIVNGTAERPSRIAGWLTPAHDRLVSAALQKEPAQRPTAEAFADLLAHVRAHPGRRRSWLPWVLLLVGATILAGGGALAIAGSGPRPVRTPTPSVAPSPPSATPRPTPTAAPAPRPTTPTRRGPDAELWKQYDQLAAAHDGEGMVAITTHLLQRSPESIEVRVAMARGYDLSLRRTRVKKGLTSLFNETRGRDLAPRERRALATAHLLMAQHQFARGQPARCLAELSLAVQLAPADPTARTRRGLSLLFSGQKNVETSTCRDDLERAVRDGPRHPEALRNLATLRWDDGRESYTPLPKRAELYAEAERLFARALAANPNDAEAHQLRAWLRRDQERDAERDRDYDAALERFRAFRDEAGPFYRAALRLRAEYDAPELEQAVQKFNEVQFAFARTTAANRRHPLANAQSGRLMLEYAARMLLRSQAPTHPEIRRAAAQALQALKWARSVNARSWEAAAWLAEAYALPGPRQRPKLALQHAEAALGLANPPSRTLALRAKAAALVAGRRHEEALVMLAIVIGARPRDWIARWLRARALEGLQRPTEAKQAAERARRDLRW